LYAVFPSGKKKLLTFAQPNDTKLNSIGQFMFIIHTVLELQQLLALARKQNKTIGFVPTMGALHFGHVSLVRAAKAQCALTVVSIFVNPTQFNNRNDLRNYPRTLKNDTEMLHAVGADMVFVPDDKEIYPEPDTRLFDFGPLGKRMEGAHRRGHFNGVAQVVDRLFAIVRPDAAFFGEKDYQQLVIIRALAAQMMQPPVIIACPIVREPDGLAMSSRNMLLTEPQRAHAPVIAATLFEAKRKARTMPVTALKKWVANSINADAELEVEYVEIANEQTLQPVRKWEKDMRLRLFVAVYARPVRLIDNIAL
jgi:pantoate--beta-alanine ligase